MHAVAPVRAFAVVLGIAVLWDLRREPLRDFTRPMTPVDNRTYRDAQRLLDAEASDMRGI